MALVPLICPRGEVGSKWMELLKVEVFLVLENDIKVISNVVPFSIKQKNYQKDYGFVSGQTKYEAAMNAAASNGRVKGARNPLTGIDSTVRIVYRLHRTARRLQA